MDKLLHGLGGMKLSSAAHKKVDRLDDILHNLQGLDVRSRAEQRSTKLISRKKRFSFDQEGITHIANALRGRGPEGILKANRLEELYRQYTHFGGQAFGPRAAAIDDIIKHFNETPDWQSTAAPSDDTVWGRTPTRSEEPDVDWLLD